MASETCVGAIDQGTTGTRFVVVDRDGHIVGSAYERHQQSYPAAGWVEHDPVEIWTNTKRVVVEGLAAAGLDADQLAAIGIANQRETTLLWDRATGDPLYPAIVWQDSRTTARVEALEAEGKADWIRDRTGLEVDTYFSATKASWLLDHLGEAVRDRAAAGEVVLGTVDAWLVDRLTGTPATDVTNASRTMLFDIDRLCWDEELLSEFDVPRAALPTVRPSSDAKGYGSTDSDGFLGTAVPVGAVLGDQQAALFGQLCVAPGEVKNTYGTGSFVLMNTGTEPVASDAGLLTTVAFQRAGAPASYALEGSIFATGAAIEWLCDLGLVEDAAASEAVARSVASTDGVYFVPAFTGLGAPHWDGRARGTIVGMTRDTGPAHIVRAALEAIGFRTREVVEAMVADAGLPVETLRIDGGAVENDLLCQLQADIVGTAVQRPVVDESTALGAAFAAGRAVGYWADLDELRATRRVDRTFHPDAEQDVDAWFARWQEAVERAGAWARDT